MKKIGKDGKILVLAHRDEWNNLPRQIQYNTNLCIVVENGYLFLIKNRYDVYPTNTYITKDDFLYDMKDKISESEYKELYNNIHDRAFKINKILNG